MTITGSDRDLYRFGIGVRLAANGVYFGASKS